MLLGIPRSARCVQRFDDSLNSAIHITYRISLRSSSMREPRDPLLKVVMCLGRRCPRSFYEIQEFVKGTASPAKARPSQRFTGVWFGRRVREPAARRLRRCRADPNGRTNTLMILPQVHLRKPCYDFYFL